MIKLKILGFNLGADFYNFSQKNPGADYNCRGVKIYHGHSLTFFFLIGTTGRSPFRIFNFLIGVIHLTKLWSD